MPVDPQAFDAARVESMLSLAIEAAEQGDPDSPLPEDVQAQIRAIGEMTPEDLEESPEEESSEGGDSQELAEDETPPPEEDEDTFATAPFGAE